MGAPTAGTAMIDPVIEPIEIDLLLEAVFRRYGYDFRSYARASLERRTRQFLTGTGCASVSAMIPRVLHDQEFFWRLAQCYSVSVTEMFRDPFVYRAVRESVVPALGALPRFAVWHAGCATGEEVYSLAIVLEEEGVLDRAAIHATDFNDEVLESARKGVYAAGRMKAATQNYLLAGGKRSLSEYYEAGCDVVEMAGSLKARIAFANHNLTADAGFGQMHVVFCRNVLIYFNRELQNRVLGLFTEHLACGGFLCLGAREDIRFAEVRNRYEVVDGAARIYRKKDA